MAIRYGMDSRGANLFLPFDPLACQAYRQPATLVSQQDPNKPPDASLQQGLQAGSQRHDEHPMFEALGLEAFMMPANSGPLDTGSATRPVSPRPAGISQLSGTHTGSHGQLPAQKSGSDVTADMQLVNEGRSGSPPDQAISDRDLSPQAAPGGRDAQAPSQAATATTEAPAKVARMPCSKSSMSQLTSVSQAAADVLGWAKAQVHRLAAQGGGQKSSPLLEEAEDSMGSKSPFGKGEHRAEKSTSYVPTQPSNQSGIPVGSSVFPSLQEDCPLPQAATESRHLPHPAAMEGEPDPPGISGLKASQVIVIYEEVTKIYDWMSSREPMVSKQAGRRLTAAYLEVAERHQQELESHLSMLAAAVASCEDRVTRMVGLFRPAFAANLPKLLRTGDKLGRHDQEHTDAAWHAFPEQLQMLPDNVKGDRSPADMINLVQGFQGEFISVKQATDSVHKAKADLDRFKERIAKPAAKQNHARKAKPADHAMSPEEFEASSSRSAAAAAALLEEAEAEKAAIKQKPKLPAKAAKASKKSKMERKSVRNSEAAPLNASDNQTAGRLYKAHHSTKLDACSS